MTTPDEIRGVSSLLREAGYDPAAAPDDAVATLRKLRGQPGIIDGAVARALGSIVAAASAELLAEMEVGASGPNRREIRRALFRLRQAGIEPPAKASVTSAPSRAAADTAIEAVLSPIDATGVQLVWLVKARPRGGLARLWGFVSETDGLVGCELSTVSRRDLRRDRTMVEARSGGRLINADWRLADFILCEAYRRTPEDKRTAVGNFLALRAELIGSPPAADFEHPIYMELAAEAAAEPPADLLREPEMAALRFPEELLKPFVEEIAEIRNSVIVLSQAQNDERVGKVIENAIALLLGGDRLERTRRRLEDTAYYLAHTGRRVPAGWAAGAAKRLREGIDPVRIAPLRELVRASVGAQIAQQDEKAREEPRLIMTPAEAMQAQARRSRGR
jgi:hypothetical protein